MRKPARIGTFRSAEREGAEADATLRDPWRWHRGKPCRKATVGSKPNARQEELLSLGAARPEGLRR